MKIYLNSLLFTQAFNEKWLKELSLFVLMSNVYPNKTIWFKSKEKTKKIEELAEKLGLSKNTLRKHLQFLVKKKLIKIDCNSINLTPNKKINKKYKTTKYVYVEQLDNIKSIMNSLMSIIVKTNCNRQKKAIERKEHLCRKDNDGGTNSINYEITLSNKRLAEILNVKSKKTVKKFKKQCKEYKTLNFERNIKEAIHDITWAQFKQLKKDKIIPIYSTFKKLTAHIEYANLIKY